MSTASLFFFGSENCPGARNPKTESKDRHQRRCVFNFVSKNKKMRRGQTIAQEQLGLPGKMGKHGVTLFV